ncbi:phosphomannomutase/phosphoglucomutase [Marinobacter changyiensis]|uniref:phosphomannomutase/phosphoglucomutase n=1 Tax=Marinobacter changyiensis TaxID=2604091 RepID=UPI00126451BB|nr:phosphomannomutase/phosphoglucomutase [Marinobacter changyiensis]
MKLGKKKSSEALAMDSTDTRKKRTKAEKPGQGPKLKRLADVLLQQVVVILLAGVAASVLLFFLVLAPAESRFRAVHSEAMAEQAVARVEQRLSILQNLVNGYGSQSAVRNALTETASQRAIAGDLVTMMPGTTEVFVFPYGDIPRRSDNGRGLGFASLDLARRAESGRQIAADAFPRDDQWFVQLAAPVRNPSSQAVQGTVLVVFSADILAPALASDAGKVEIIQTVSGRGQTLIGRGEGAAGVMDSQLTPPNWTLRFTPSAKALPAASPIIAMVLVAAPSLLAAIVVWLLMANTQRSLRREVATLIQWAHKAFSGERTKLPNFKWDMVASVGEVLLRLAQAVDKRLVKATEASRAQPARPAPGSGRAKTDTMKTAEPLFQDKDMLDIDMLDGDEDVLGFGGQDRPDEFGLGVEETGMPGVEVVPGIFRAYDIRGIVGDTLTADVVMIIGQAIGSEALARQTSTLCVGYDGRHSSPELAQALGRGIMATGCDVIDVGAVPTPVLYFATHHLNTGSGVMVTGSHNPSNYNGLKIMLGGETLSGDAIQKLLHRIQTGDFEQGHGARSEQDMRRAYLDRIIEDIAVAAPLKIVMDAGNGIAGELGPLLAEELGCEVIRLYCDVDGDFPNHHPDPGKPDNLVDLIERVKAEKADIGLAFDGDGDRLGVVTNTGKIIWPDRLLMLFARDVVSRNPGADVIYDVKCSRRLAGVISQAGGRPIMWKTGHSLIKAKMRETGALLAGEMSGHVFFKERWYGFDDGIYAAARLLEILGVEDRQCDEVFAEFPDDISTPELNVEVSDETKFALVEKLSNEGDFGDGNLNTIDGVRVDYPDGWGLCRASNTTPVLVLRFEAESGEALERIKAVFREQLMNVAPGVVPTF